MRESMPRDDSNDELFLQQPVTKILSDVCREHSENPWNVFLREESLKNKIATSPDVFDIATDLVDKMMSNSREHQMKL